MHSRKVHIHVHIYNANTYAQLLHIRTLVYDHMCTWFKKLATHSHRLKTYNYVSLQCTYIKNYIPTVATFTPVYHQYLTCSWQKQACRSHTLHSYHHICLQGIVAFGCHSERILLLCKLTTQLFLE